LKGFPKEFIGSFDNRPVIALLLIINYKNSVVEFLKQANGAVNTSARKRTGTLRPAGF